MAVTRRTVIATLICCAAVLGVYFLYFYHGSPEDIMSRNRKQHNKAAVSQGKFLHRAALKSEHPQVEDGGDDEDEGEEEDEDDPAVSSYKLWEQWVEENGYLSIGDIYDKCDDSKDRVTLGKVILLPDHEKGGVTSVSFLNHTIENDIDEGSEVKIEVSYNGKELYKNHWELCTIDEDEEEDRIVFCPIKKGPRTWKKEMKIPNYLPKGRYTAKAWLVDIDEKILVCGFADFTL
ncbi:phosphatidylglycerol/phosphatidylinositol transfer protein-like [Lingula anatina]|uniref:Phosphatidylglycerol/phosphatidylinositol transfer protein n=1 Tax=Lingula anatina TaxID=7574 RepID=A0A1S3IFU1_LINAN|nr:phosphatidylglycerol/phosphatidylinositol transfer protein [Lingula anatina]XP_013396731.1 phosphatidylglycerol/phosphatidylinositol transfer protein-like [Lingula anatina]|eukprot:XP_013383718.1 phosphatidylglycerol/phosphatidylinositol transfer protein [Lingula anatina]